MLCLQYIDGILIAKSDLILFAASENLRSELLFELLFV